MVQPQRDILSKTQLRNQTLGGTVFRDEPDGSGYLQPSPQRKDSACNGPQQLALSVPLHRSDSDDLSCLNPQRSMPNAIP